MKDSERGGPSLPRPRDAGPSCRLGPDRARIPAASKSRIVGIPPFPSRTKMAGHDDARPLEAITVEKQAYLASWGRTGHGPLRLRNHGIVGKWPFSDCAENTERNGACPLSAPTPRKQAYLQVVRTRGWPYAPRDRHAPPDGPMLPSSTNFVIQPEIPGTPQVQQKQKPSHLRGSLAGMPGLEPRMAEPESAVLPITPHPNLAGVATSKSCPSYPQPDLNRCWRRERA